MKQILVSAVFSALAILLIPSQLRPDEPVPAVPEDTVLWIEDAGPEAHWKETVSEPETAGLETVRLLDGGTVQLLPMDDYLTCVVLSEMPPEFESEALKAQAVAARTFTEKRRLSAKHENADVCSDSACCQAWQSEAALREKFGADFDVYEEKARAAVEATRDEALFYDGALIDATYFSCSNGKTETAVAVWGTDVPYLQSVESFGEESALRYESEVVCTAAQLREKLSGAELDARRRVGSEPSPIRTAAASPPWRSAAKPIPVRSFGAFLASTQRALRFSARAIRSPSPSAATATASA